MDRVTERVERLVGMGDQVLATRREGRNSPLGPVVEVELFHEWRATCLSFLQAVFGEAHVHFRQFETGCEKTFYREAALGQGIMKAAREDIRTGFLTSLANLAAADIFTDFL